MRAFLGEVHERFNPVNRGFLGLGQMLLDARDRLREDYDRLEEADILLPFSKGTASTADSQNRLVKSISSGLGASSSDGSSGSSAMPQIGHVPGFSRRISGCIGHVHIAPGEARGSGRGVSDRYLAGSAVNFARHPALQK